LKLASPKAASRGEQRRAGRQIDRQQAPTMRGRFAAISKLQIDLSFSGSSRATPSAQLHSFYPPARAFFRFACPYSDCDGEFDLTANVVKLAEGPPGARVDSGRMSCPGVHYRDSTTAAPCSLAVVWRLVITQPE
jgi:hypothetical protein